MRNKPKRGLVMVMVLFFAFAMAIVLCVLLSSNSTIGQQNKNMLRQLQAYYLTQSGVQHTFLKIRLLPKETFELLKAGGTGVFADVGSDNHPDLRLDPVTGVAAFDLFGSDPGPRQSPYRGTYSLVNIGLSGSHKGMKLAQDAYEFEIRAEVFPYFPKSEKGRVADTVREEVFISRFTAGSD